MGQSITDQLRRMGWKDDQIAAATVDGKPLSEVAMSTKSKPAKGMNSTEKLYAAELDWLKREGTVKAWWFEDIRLKLANRTTYTPDFCVWYSDEKVQFVEIKGRILQDDASVKFKWARKEFPMWEFVMLRRESGLWVPVKI
jgi:hypothetical protein